MNKNATPNAIAMDQRFADPVNLYRYTAEAMPTIKDRFLTKKEHYEFGVDSKYSVLKFYAEELGIDTNNTHDLLKKEKHAFAVMVFIERLFRVMIPFSHELQKNNATLPERNLFLSVYDLEERIENNMLVPEWMAFQFMEDIQCLPIFKKAEVISLSKNGNTIEEYVEGYAFPTNAIFSMLNDLETVKRYFTDEDKAVIKSVLEGAYGSTIDADDYFEGIDFVE